MRRRGFTLIELLIVVAIISILAAIAVPNYLHAQLRAKVARVKAELNTIAVAIESYAADHGVYPPTQTYFNTTYSAGWRLLPCTTPVPYMVRLYEDPFSYISGRSAGAAAGPNQPPTANFTTAPIYYPWRNLTEIVVNGVVVRDPVLAQQRYWTMQTGLYPIWVLFSFGPDLDYRGGYLDPTYDPSNGLNSDGDIFNLGPGFGFINKRAG